MVTPSLASIETVKAVSCLEELDADINGNLKASILSGVRADQKNGIDLPDLSMKLANIGLTRILVEGGGDLATSLLNQGLVDLLILFTAGILVDKEGLNGFNPIIKSSTTLSESPKFSLERTFRVGNDVAHLWRPLDSKESN